jgi:SAM-dependent methyltransferase
MMSAYDVMTYGERMAEVYDQWPGIPPNTETVVDALTRLAGRGPVLELGIGTGRIALPLAQRGLHVHGIDASPAMIARLKAKPGGERIPVTNGSGRTPVLALPQPTGKADAKAVWIGDGKIPQSV